MSEIIYIKRKNKRIYFDSISEGLAKAKKGDTLVVESEWIEKNVRLPIGKEK